MTRHDNKRHKSLGHSGPYCGNFKLGDECVGRWANVNCMACKRSLQLSRQLEQSERLAQARDARRHARKAAEKAKKRPEDA